MTTKNDKPKVSVLMPVYNTKEEYLREAIESILNQTFRDFEFLIIDDGSTNNAKEVIWSYRDRRIKYFEQENRGLIYTLNKGLELCKGEYIARMDSDDISLPERFEKQVDYLDEHPETGLVGSLIKTFPQENIIYIKEYSKYLDMIKGNQVAHPSIMVRKSILEKYHLKYENYLHAEDYELWTRMIKYTELYNLQEVLLNYRCHNDQISSAFSEIQQETTKKIKQNMLDFLTDDKELQQKILNLVCPQQFSQKMKYTFWQRIFSLRNQKITGKKKKILTIFGVEIVVGRK
ncbi:MAG: glycosyltransferase [Alphaproteobacteria bacterium]|nr:glycosyltransferase [Alphaproteobacteria bacterium]